jgi:hypothetical protein
LQLLGLLPPLLLLLLLLLCRLSALPTGCFLVSISHADIAITAAA